MSWDSYVQNLIDGGMKDCAIAGLEDGGWMVAAPGSHVIINLPNFANLSPAFNKMIQKYIEVKGWKATYAVVNFGYSSGTDGGTESKMRKSGKKEIFNEAVSRNRTWDPWILPLLALVFWVLNRQLKGQEKVK